MLWKHVQEDQCIACSERKGELHKPFCAVMLYKFSEIKKAEAKEKRKRQ